MNVNAGADRCAWEERLLGRFGTWRRVITIAVLILLGGSVAYVEIGRASRPRTEPAMQQGAVFSDIAVPEPLIEQALRQEGNPMFADFHTYDEFLVRHGLAEGVLITRVCSEQGDFLYHAFPPLRDRDTYALLNASLPDLVSGHPDQTRLHDIRVHLLPAAQLRTRSAAVAAFPAEVFASQPPPGHKDRRRIDEKGDRSRQEGTEDPSPVGGSDQARIVPEVAGAQRSK
jgi:hypothetical protein